jgi:hypothetical protein
LAYTVPGVGQICGYKDLSDVQALYALDAEISFRRKKADLEAARIEELKTVSSNLTEAVGAQRRATAIVADRNTELTRQLIETDRKYQKERVKPRWGNPLAWGLAASLGAGLLGVLGHELID